jgi:hypothetical protein
MSITNRREPRDRPDRPANRNHTHSATPTTHGPQPPPLDNRSSIWATREPHRSEGVALIGPLAASTHDRPRYRERPALPVGSSDARGPKRDDRKEFERATVVCHGQAFTCRGHE